MGTITRCTMQKLIVLLVLVAALFIATDAANSCKKCSFGSACTTKTCSGSQLCIAKTYVGSSINVTMTDCDSLGSCTAYDVKAGKCKTITGFGAATKYYCSTSTPTWASTAATT